MKLTKRLLAMALAGVMLLTILTGCSGGKTGDRLVEEYMATFLSEIYGLGDIPITHDVPEIKTVADMFKASWLEDDGESGEWDIPLPATHQDSRYDALQGVFSKYDSGYTVILCARKVDSKQSELNQTMRVMTSIFTGLTIHTGTGLPTAAKCATRLVTREGKSYRIAVVIYDHTAG